MTISAFDLQKESTATTDAGTNVLKRAVSSPTAGDVYYTRLDVGTGTALTEASSSAPLHVEIVDVTNTLVADIGAIKTAVEGTLTVGSHAVTNAGTFAVQVDGTALTRLTDIETNTDFGAVTGGGVEASALRVTIASDSTGVLSVDDNGGSLTVDGTVTANAGTGTFTVDNGGTFAVQVDGTALTRLTDIETNTDALANVHSEDFDSGAGTDTTAAFGIAVPASGGAVVVPGDATAGLKVDLGSDNDVTVTGTVTANLSATDNAVLDQIEVNTSYGDNTGGGTEAGCLRVTIANDSTGVVSVDDGGGSLTVDGTVTANAGTGTFTVDNAGTFAVQSTLQTGSNTIGKLAANSGVDIGDVDVTSISAGTNTIGGVFDVASTSAAGSGTFYDNDLDETKVEVTDNATVRIYSIHVINTTAAPLYLQLFDLDADSVTVGATTPTNQYVIPGNADSDGAGFVINFSRPKAYSTGFTVACTTDSEGSGAPAANACHVNIEYLSA